MEKPKPVVFVKDWPKAGPSEVSGAKKKGPKTKKKGLLWNFLLIKQNLSKTNSISNIILNGEQLKISPVRLETRQRIYFFHI